MATTSGRFPRRWSRTVIRTQECDWFRFPNRRPHRGHRHIGLPAIERVLKPRGRWNTIIWADAPGIADSLSQHL
jgi:hypothetical protein